MKTKEGVFDAVKGYAGTIVIVLLYVLVPAVPRIVQDVMRFFGDWNFCILATAIGMFVLALRPPYMDREQTLSTRIGVGLYLALLMVMLGTIFGPIIVLFFTYGWPYPLGKIVLGLLALACVVVGVVCYWDQLTHIGHKKTDPVLDEANRSYGSVFFTVTVRTTHKEIVAFHNFKEAKLLGERGEISDKLQEVEVWKKTGLHFDPGYERDLNSRLNKAYDERDLEQAAYRFFAQYVKD